MRSTPQRRSAIAIRPSTSTREPPVNGPPVAVEAIARQVDQLVGEDGRDLEKEEAGEPEREGRGRQMAALAQAQDGAQRVGEPSHHVELQAERREPRHKALAMVEPGPARAALEPLAQCAGLGEPSLPALRRGVLYRSEDRSAHGGHAAEAERRPGEPVEPGRPIDETMDQRWGVHRDDEMGRLAAQQTLVSGPALAFDEGPAGQKHAVEKAFEECRHRSPPGREDEDEVIGPVDERDCLLDGRLELLVAGRAAQHVELEGWSRRGRAAAPPHRRWPPPRHRHRRALRTGSPPADGPGRREREGAAMVGIVRAGWLPMAVVPGNGGEAAGRLRRSGR